MRNATKIWLMIAASLVIFGLITCAAVMTVYHWDFTKLGTVRYRTNTYQIKEAFSSISIQTDTADIRFLPSDDNICKVVCYEQEKEKHTAIVQDDTLSIEVVNQRKWYDYIGISFGIPKITVYLPETDYDALFINESTGDIEIPQDFQFERIDISTSTGNVKSLASALDDIKIMASTGSIHVENIRANALDLSVSTGTVIAKSITCEGNMTINVSTGDAQLTDVRCKTVNSSGSTGDIVLKNVIATETLSVARSTGDVLLNQCDAAELLINTDTGDVTGTLLSSKVFITETSTGTVNVPKSTDGGKCEITTSTGDIHIEIDPAEHRLSALPLFGS